MIILITKIKMEMNMNGQKVDVIERAGLLSTVEFFIDLGQV
jgi:hypothetical protein